MKLKVGFHAEVGYALADLIDRICIKTVFGFGLYGVRLPRFIMMCTVDTRALITPSY